MAENTETLNVTDEQGEVNSGFYVRPERPLSLLLLRFKDDSGARVKGEDGDALCISRERLKVMS